MVTVAGRRGRLELDRAARRAVRQPDRRRGRGRPWWPRRRCGTPATSRAPLLVCVCDRENLMDPQVRRAGWHSTAPRGVARHYDSDHFAIYHPPLVDQVLADQTAFLQEHLDVRA